MRRHRLEARIHEGPRGVVHGPTNRAVAWLTNTLVLDTTGGIGVEVPDYGGRMSCVESAIIMMAGHNQEVVARVNHSIHGLTAHNDASHKLLAWNVSQSRSQILLVGLLSEDVRVGTCCLNTS